MKKDLIEIPMSEFWKRVMIKINKVNKSDLISPVYISEVCKGKKRNVKIDAVKKGCMRAVVDELLAIGCTPKSDVSRYCR